jgi:hypothetical protein
MEEDMSGALCSFAGKITFTQFSSALAEDAFSMVEGARSLLAPSSGVSRKGAC